MQGHGERVRKFAKRAKWDAYAFWKVTKHFKVLNFSILDVKFVQKQKTH